MWRKPSPCVSEDHCVEVARTDTEVLVRDSKLGDASPTLTYPPAKWAALLDRIKAGEQWDAGLEFFPLTFDDAERDAFVAGVVGGEFDA